MPETEYVFPWDELRITDYETYLTALRDWLKKLRLKAGMTAEMADSVYQKALSLIATQTAITELPYYGVLVSADEQDRQLEIQGTKNFLDALTEAQEAGTAQAQALSNQMLQDYITGGITWQTWAERSRSGLFNQEQLDWYAEQAQKTEAYRTKVAEGVHQANVANWQQMMEEAGGDVEKALEELNRETVRQATSTKTGLLHYYQTADGGVLWEQLTQFEKHQMIAEANLERLQPPEVEQPSEMLEEWLGDYQGGLAGEGHINRALESYIKGAAGTEAWEEFVSSGGLQLREEWYETLGNIGRAQATGYTGGFLQSGYERIAAQYGLTAKEVEELYTTGTTIGSFGPGGQQAEVNIESILSQADKAALDQLAAQERAGLEAYGQKMSQRPKDPFQKFLEGYSIENVYYGRSPYKRGFYPQYITPPARWT